MGQYTRQFDRRRIGADSVRRKLTYEGLTTMQGTSTITDRDWFMNGYSLGLDGKLLHERSPEIMWAGWGWGVLEREHIFEQHPSKQRSRRKAARKR
jgi:hypothetical protein